MQKEQKRHSASSTMSDKIRTAGLVNDSITDGPGLRFAIFLQGCDKRCPGCHNPQSLPMDGGTLYTTEDLMEKINANPLLTGITLSGGEPLLQAENVLPLVRKVREKGLDVVIYTGDTFEQIIQRNDPAQMELLSLSQTLIDGPFILEQRSLSLLFRGSENQRILDLPESLAAGKSIQQG